MRGAHGHAHHQESAKHGAFCFLVFVGLKPFWPSQTIAGQWDVGMIGSDSGPGKNGRRPGEPIAVWPG